MLYEVNANPICPICQKRINDWEITTGKTEVVINRTIHKSCKGVKTDGLDLAAGWTVSFLVPPVDS